MIPANFNKWFLFRSPQMWRDNMDLKYVIAPIVAPSIAAKVCEFFTKSNKPSVRECIEAINFSFDRTQQKRKILYWSWVQFSQIYSEIVRQLAEYSTQFDTLLFLECEFQDRFYDQLARTSWKIAYLSFTYCGLGNYAAWKLSKLDLNNLKQLYLRKDTIQNVGAKALVKRKLPALTVLSITYSDITSDVYKLFGKRTTNNFEKLLLNHYRSSTNMELLTKMYNLTDLEAKDCFKLSLGDNSIQCSCYGCLGYLSKIKMADQKIARVQLQQSDTELLNEHPYIARKLRLALSNQIDFYPVR